MVSISKIILTLVLLCSFGVPGLAQAKDIYVLSRGTARVDVFDSASSGTVSPSRTISGAVTTLSDGDTYGIAVYNGEIYVTDEDPDSINVFKLSDSGDVAPTRQIIGANADFGLPRAITIHSGFIYCLDESKQSVKVFKTSDSGNVAPTREITGFTSTPYACAIYNGELYVQDQGSMVSVFDLTATGTVAATRKRSIDLTGTMTLPRGLAVADGILYSSDGDQISSFTASASGVAAPLTTIKGGNTDLNSVHSLFIYNGNIFAANYSDDAKAVQVFSTSADLDVAADRFFTAAGLNDVISITMEANGYVAPSNNQQSGVTVTVTSSSENATSDIVFEKAFSPTFSFSKVTPLAEFEATVNSNGANGVFSFNSTSLNGTAGSYTLLKCYTTNGTSMTFGNYAPSADPDTEGTWWVENESGTYLASDAVLTSGTNYHVNFVVKDNGIYDEDRTLGQIKDPVVLGTSNSETGCVFNPAAGLGLEWLLMGFGVVLSFLRSIYKR